ncbi:Ros/MucR family transcriptional regulator [Pseudaminobacter sp. NGMCC 1.201702]|uniref:MucR family transcriptional regulator n=1 Tax=Pseudaminobacter sp. NGMCC 1.201702 TaxID=3391825 RepID=UPI0039EED183
MNEDNPKPAADLIGLTTKIVSAYVSNNSVPKTELLRLITDTHTAIAGLVTPNAPDQKEGKPVPAVSIRKSVTPDFLTCLEDGKKFKSLKRHLATHFYLTPDQYRQKWNLPADYPMVAPNYSASRSTLAKSSGLGRKAAVAEAALPVKRKKLGLKFK